MKDEEFTATYFETVAKILDFAALRLEENKSTYLCGNRLTVCDFQMAHLRWTYWENHLAVTGDYYTIKSMEMINERPLVKKYYENLYKELKPILEARKPSPF